MNDYNQQAEDFLKATGTTLKVDYLYTGPYFNDDEEKKRDVYAITLQNKKGTYSAKFGDSIHNTERRSKAQGLKAIRGHVTSTAIKRVGFSSRNEAVAALAGPSAYDILACLSSYYPETFEDFCSEFGYEDSPVDYPKIMQIFTACQAEARGMRQLFTKDELDQLADIC